SGTRKAETGGRASRWRTRATLRSRALPKLSAMAAVKYAPPAIPPRKKYQTIIISQCGVLSLRAPLVAVAECQEHAEAYGQGRTDGEQRVDDDVALRQLGIVRQVVSRRLGQQTEERVEAAQEAPGVGAVQLRVLEAHLLERLHALLRLAHQLVAEAELDGLGRARLGAGRAQAVVDPIVAEGALRGGA